MQTIERINRVQTMIHERKGALGWAFLVWLFGGSLGVVILVFIVLKMIGQ